MTDNELTILCGADYAYLTRQFSAEIIFIGLGIVRKCDRRFPQKKHAGSLL